MNDPECVGANGIRQGEHIFDIFGANKNLSCKG